MRATAARQKQVLMTLLPKHSFEDRYMNHWELSTLCFWGHRRASQE